MRRYPNPPGCAVAGALARHSARRAASTPASRRDARLLPRAGTDLSARRHRRGRARGRTRRPAPRIPRAGPGPVATSDRRRRSRRPRGGPRVDGRTEPPSASAAPNATLATRVRDATSATLAARVAKPRTAADPRAQGHPTRSSRTEGLHTAPKEKDCLSHICRPILLASSCASPCASPSALGSHARGSSRSSRSSRSGPRWGRAATPANQCFKATSAVVPKESIRRASGVAAALGVCAAKPSTRAIPVTPAAGVVTAAAATTVPPVTTESMKVRDSAILVTPTARRAK